MPLAAYFWKVGAVLLALLFVADYWLPRAPTVDQAATDRPADTYPLRSQMARAYCLRYPVAGDRRRCARGRGDRGRNFIGCGRTARYRPTEPGGGEFFRDAAETGYTPA